MNNLIALVQKKHLKKGRELKKYTVGSTVKVNTKIKEGNKERIQGFEGVIIARKGQGPAEVITVRKVSYGGIGVERIFPVHSPMIESIKIIKQGQAKRAKLYYIRETFGRKAKKEARRFDRELGAEALNKLNAVPFEEATKKEDAPAAAEEKK